MPIRTKIPEDQLRKIAREHISYEIQMFRGTISRLHSGERDQLLKNALLESFVVHARALFDFLYPGNTLHSDDVIAADFFDDASIFQATLPKSLPISSYLKSRAGKEVAHLSYVRNTVTVETKGWNIGNIHDQIGGALVIFFECLPEDRRNWFTTILTK